MCRFCDHSHVGPIGHDIATYEGQGSSERFGRHIWKDGSVEDVVSNLRAYHSQDRLKLIRHHDKPALKRLPAVVELCIQAGVDLHGYPVVRNMKPVHGLGRKKPDISDMYFDLSGDSEPWEEEEEPFEDIARSKAISLFGSSLSKGEKGKHASELEDGVKMSPDRKFEEANHGGFSESSRQSSEDTKQVAEMALRLWEVMRSGAQSLMTRYTVRACGYCPEVHIGPRGHMVRLCGAFKHEYRQGKHGWQVAGLDDLIPPKYVWHVLDLKKPLLINDSRNFYGQAPAVVELCVQAGAAIPDKYRAMMRLDVITPTCYEAETAV
ncbi:hypothetical protein L7F22_008418 [Adiantum nelumboides]|nr:hypothetical protein [Adiantum nelumboides]